MKKLHKIICTVITVTLLTGILAVPASADSVPHRHRVCEALNTIANMGPSWQKAAIAIRDELRARSSAQAVVDFANPDDIEMSYPTCDTAITCEEMTVPEAKAQGAIGLFESKYGERVKVYTMGKYSKEICGGPHANNTGDLVSFKILKEESSSAGVRRIKAVIGKKEE